MELTGEAAFSYYHEGHFVLCFMAFLMERTLEIELRKNNVEYSPQRIRKALAELEYSEMVVENKTFCLRSPVEGLANDILRVMKIKIPPQITTLVLSHQYRIP